MVDLSGFGGSGHIDPVTGEWVSETPGTTLTSTPEDLIFAQPQGGQVGFPRGSYGPSPNSSTGAPASYPRAGTTVTSPSGGTSVATRPINTPNSSTGETFTPPNWAQAAMAARGGAYGLGAWLMGKTIEPQTLNQGEQDVINRHLPAPNSTIGTQTGTQVGTPSSVPFYNPLQTAVDSSPFKMPIPPGGGGLPPYPPSSDLPGGLPPMRPLGAIPTPFSHLPRHDRAPAVQTRQPVGALSNPNAAPAPTPQADVPGGHYRASVGNARGQTWVPGGEDQVSPQIYRGPQTMYGAPNVAGSGPRGAQNYYTAGSAPMAPGDWTGTGPAAPPLSNPVWGANMPGQSPVRGRGGAAPVAPTAAPAAPTRTPPINPNTIALQPHAGPSIPASQLPSRNPKAPLGTWQNPAPMY